MESEEEKRNREEFAKAMQDLEGDLNRGVDLPLFVQHEVLKYRSVARNGADHG